MLQPVLQEALKLCSIITKQVLDLFFFFQYLILQLQEEILLKGAFWGNDNQEAGKVCLYVLRISGTASGTGEKENILRFLKCSSGGGVEKEKKHKVNL